jgi:hypothetical protein
MLCPYGWPSAYANEVNVHAVDVRLQALQGRL